MSFNHKLNKFFQNPEIRLNPVPPRHLLHLYADYVELVSVFSNQNHISASNIQDRLSDEGILIKKDEANLQAEENDKNEAFIKSIFGLIADRASLFGGDYPFLVKGNDKIILREAGDITEWHKIYIFLLLSSSLNLFPAFQPELTKEFEKICVEALSAYLPEYAVIKSFGKNSDYKGTAIEKINKLADDLGISVNHEALDQISVAGNQERGLDLIGWIPFDDSVPNLLTILGQCTCEKKWYKKLMETARYENYYNFHVKEPIHAMFIPYAIINYQRNNFYQHDEIRDRLIFERKRILNFIEEAEFFSHFETKSLVDRCIEFEEDIV